MLAAVQAYAIAIGLEQWGTVVDSPGMAFRISTVITLTGGTIFLMWLGEQITARGVGNGISLIIMAGIVARIPSFLFRCSSRPAPGASIRARLAVHPGLRR
jgi:preprotein translocase subunit SecY